ncbi:MAG: hypothetical protein DDT26_00276 [Dehalococcoidia bacterium]|nr:hypothetical protein [Chloroflexota bacterium]
MSIEEALLKNAEAQSRLAGAMTRYAEVMEAATAIGVKMLEAGAPPGRTPDLAPTPTPTPTPTPAAETSGKTRGRPRKEEAKPTVAAPPAEEVEEEAEGDDWGDEQEESAPEYTAVDVRTAILKVRDKGGEKSNAAAAKRVLEMLGVKSMSEIPEDKYAKAISLCEKALKS